MSFDLVDNDPNAIPSPTGTIGDVYVSATRAPFAPHATNAGGATLRPLRTKQSYAFVAEADGTNDYFVKIAVDCEARWGCERRDVTISNLVVNPVSSQDRARLARINGDFQFGLSGWSSTPEDRGGAYQTVDSRGAACRSGNAHIFRKWENYYGGKSQLRKSLLPLTQGASYTVSFDYRSPTANATAFPRVLLESAKPNSAGVVSRIVMEANPPAATESFHRFAHTFVMTPELAGRLTHLVIDNAGDGHDQMLIVGPVSITAAP